LKKYFTLLSSGSWYLGRLWPVVLLVGLLLLQACGDGRRGPLKLGDQAPSFTATDLDGNPFNLADYQGRPVIIRFFLTDCPFCKADTPIFLEYYLQNRERGLVMVYINSRDATPEATIRFNEEQHLVFPVIFDQGGEIAKRYQIKMMPQTLILNPQHQIIGAFLGGVSRAEMAEFADPFLLSPAKSGAAPQVE
jgi:peroxiredoxin